MARLGGRGRPNPASGRVWPVEVSEILTDGSPAAVARAVERHQAEQSMAWTRAIDGRVDERPEWTMFVSGLQVSWANGVADARLPPGDADAWIAEAIEAFRSAGVPAMWWVGPNSRPADLAERLVRHGFRSLEDMPWLAADLERVDLTSGDVTGLVIRRVDGPETQAAWLHAMAHGFGLPEEVRLGLQDLAARVGYGPDAPWVRFAGFLDGRPAASSGMTAFGGVAGVYNVATLPKARRRGVGTAMSVAAMREGQDRGYRIAVLGTSPMGRGVYERLGFREACVLRDFVWEPSTE